MHVRLLVLSVFFILGLGLLSGITGNVISETCCSGESCIAQNQCKLEEPVAIQNTIGVLIVLLSIALTIGELYFMRTKVSDEKKEEKIERVI